MISLFLYLYFILGRSVEKTSSQSVGEALYLDLEDLKQFNRHFVALKNGVYPPPKSTVFSPIKISEKCATVLYSIKISVLF